MTGRTIARAGKKNKSSQTPGKMKSTDCQATPLDRWMAKHNRSYKHREYSNWCKTHKGIK